MWLENELELKGDIERVTCHINLAQFVAEFHLRIVYQVWSDYYRFYSEGKGLRSKVSLTHQHLFDNQFDYPKYLEFLKKNIDREKLEDIEFDDGDLLVPYRHNIPAKDFFKVRVSFFKVGNWLK